MQLIKPERGVGDIHSRAADLLLFDRALIGGRLINEEALAEMFLLFTSLRFDEIEKGL